MTARRAETAVAVALAIAGAFAFARIADFGTTRFFTIDEYQYGHATWLVAHGRLPYVDFFEHHFPASYVLHAPFFAADRSFESAAILLRAIVLAYLFGAACLTGLGAWWATRDAAAAVASAFVPATIGFGLMSAVEYRSESFGAFCLLASLVLLERNRDRRSAALAASSGVLAALAACMTQKMAFVGGATLASMWLVDAATRGRAPGAPRYAARPVALFGAVAAVGAVALAAAAASGILAAGFDATILQAVRHERAYEHFSLFGRGYVDAYWSTTWRSSAPILALAFGYLATRAGRFWAFPLGAAALGGTLMAAPYPYNFVLPCWILGLAAVRGLAVAVAAVRTRLPHLAAAAPLLYLLVLPAVADQLRYVADVVTNAHQLATLAKIERYGAPDDAVIDNAGGAMFSPSATYYFHHGTAHRVMFRDYFETQLVRDYRESRALFWIRDRRAKQLPESARDYLESHYVRGDGDLFVLGFRTAPTADAPSTATLDVVRAGDYYLHRTSPPPADRPRRPTDLLLDGRPLRENPVVLEERSYALTVLPYSSGYLVTPLPAAFFRESTRDDGDDGKRPRFSMLFQYDPDDDSDVD